MKDANKIEKYLEDKLIKNNIKYEREYYIKGTHKNKKYDFLIVEFNTIIEIDGPLHYSPKQIKKDKIYTKIAKEKGFNIIRIEAEKKYIDEFILKNLNNKIKLKSKNIGSKEFKQKFMSYPQYIYNKIILFFNKKI
jgi:very-short-patch-repair endonuclease